MRAELKKKEANHEEFSIIVDLKNVEIYEVKIK